MTNEHRAEIQATRKTKSDLVTFSELLPHIADAHRSSNPVRREALVELAAMAAATLGRMSKRQRRIWTGWIGNQHFWRGRLVILPNGIIAEVFGIRRGQAAVRWSDPNWIEGVRRDVLPVDELAIYKNPAAILLGKLKRGCKEKISAIKQFTARQNGSRPCSPGRRRGRPTKVRQCKS